MDLRRFLSFFVIICLSSSLIIVSGCASQEEIQEEEEVGRILSFKKEISRAETEEKNGELLLSRKYYRQALDSVTEADEAAIRKKIEALNLSILFSGIIEKGSLLYQVEPGDSLDKIAKKFNTTIDLLKKANGLSSDMIKAGDTLKVSQAVFSVVVDKSQNLLFLKKDEELFKTFVVSTGKDNTTPVGTFKIVTKLKDPTWFRKDVGAALPPESPDNILGSRWMGFDLAGYGIHGTTEPENLGSYETKGCVRMRNEEVEELFAILPRGAEVTIVD
ncbi:L,D-transpeptidase family protein [Candidatus Omnitrophota bacterium]